MTPRHHPSAATLFAYAAGTLSAGFALAVVSHLGCCAECRHRVGELETVGGVLLDEIEPVAMAEDALAQVLARIEAPMPEAPAGNGRDDDPMRLLDRLRSDPGAADTLHWHRLVPGIAHIEIRPRSASGGNAQLFRVEAGKALPHHGHSGGEATIIFSGAFSDQFGRFGPGDFAETDADDWHQPVAAPESACICLIATESPLRFTGIVARIMQPFFRI